MPTADDIAAFAFRLRYDDVPPAVLDDVKLRFMDTLGVCLLSSQLDFARPFVDVVLEQGGRPEASLIGSGHRVPANQAALVNGSLAHGAEYDDTDASSGIHPSCFVVTSALSMGERQRVDGRALLAAAVAGYELALRLGRSGMNHHSPFHPTAIAGTFATTVVAGKLLGLDEQQIASALGIAGSQAAGSWKFLEDGSGVKRLHGGWPGHCGITAALLVERGLAGPHDIFDGPRGTLASYGSAEGDAAGLLYGLGQVWLTPGTTYKVYPCCSLCQAAMDAARALQRQHEFTADDLAHIDCFVSPEAFGIVCEPRQDKLSPKSPYQAAFSLPFCVAVALLDETVSVDSFQARLDDPLTLGLAERVVGVTDSGLRVADGQPARVAIKLRDGRWFERAATLRGTPENPFAATEVEAKFRENAGRGLPTDQVSAAIECLRNLELLEDVGELTALLAAAAIPVQN
jgi:2-methylcitrate dehydratase PrpD